LIKAIRCAVLGLIVAGSVASNLAARPPYAGPQGSPPTPASQPLAKPAAPHDATQTMPGMSDMPGMSPASTPAKPAGSVLLDHSWCEDKTWSTFNHRMAGWFLLLWGLAALVAGLQWPRRTWVRFAAPMVLFGLAEFLFFRNDPEAWPVGPMTFWASLHNPEDLQHRIFLLLVILIALVELLRAAGRLPGFLARYGLPLLGTFGAVFLFFHKHGGPEMDMNSMQGMASMDLVRHEHLWFSTFGFALVAAKLIADAGYLKGRKAALWSVFAVLLGAYMIGYVE
jgi:hypothetical protein